MKKIVCYGDSITFGYRVGSGRQVEVPYPKALQNILGDNYKVINEGHSGWRSTTALRNLKCLVLDEKPDIVFLMLGINDALGSEFGRTKKFIEYFKNIQEIYNYCINDNIEIYILIPTPTIWEQVEEFSRKLKLACTNNNIKFIDIHDWMINFMEENQFKSEDCIPDGVHFADDKYSTIAFALHELGNFK